MPVRLTVVGESCPVCGSEAERGQDTRDVVNIRCPRCGPFTISGTALAMLTSRLENNQALTRSGQSCDPLSTTSDEHWLEIDSTSVDKRGRTIASHRAANRQFFENGCSTS